MVVEMEGECFTMDRERPAAATLDRHPRDKYYRNYGYLSAKIYNDIVSIQSDDGGQGKGKVELFRADRRREICNLTG